MSADRTHGGVYPDVERVDMVIKQMAILGFGSYYVEAVQAARDALARESTTPGYQCGGHVEFTADGTVLHSPPQDPEPSVEG